MTSNYTLLSHNVYRSKVDDGFLRMRNMSSQIEDYLIPMIKKADITCLLSVADYNVYKNFLRKVGKKHCLSEKLIVENEIFCLIYKTGRGIIVGKPILIENTKESRIVMWNIGNQLWIIAYHNFVSNPLTQEQSESRFLQILKEQGHSNDQYLGFYSND